MDALILTHQLRGGDLYEASFCPQIGMNLLSLKRGGVEVIDQKTLPLFQERMAGLGAMIGPHFHQRETSLIPSFDNMKLFPHIKKMKEQGKREYFSHGIGRYVPWRIISVTSGSVQAYLSGKDHFGDVPLRDIEGQDFEMHYRARLIEEGLEIYLKFSAQNEAVMGLHTYYALPSSGGHIESYIQDVCNVGGEFTPIPSNWSKDGKLSIDLDRQYDHGFLGFPSFNQGEIEYRNELFRLCISYFSSKSCSWQLYRPENSTFVCIEPICARNPRSLTEKSGEIKILIQINMTPI